MPRRFLSGAESRFSDCFLVLTYRYKGGKLNSTQKTTVLNINRQRIEAPLVEKQGPMKQLQQKFKRRVQNNQATSVILDLEQVPIQNILSAINETKNYIIGDVRSVTFDDVVISTVSGNSFGNRVVNRPGVECNFGFTFKYEVPRGSSWDEDYIRNNAISLETSNPNIRKIVDIQSDRITEEDFAVRGRTLTVDFTINQETVTQDEITAITNAVDGYVNKATSANVQENQRLLTVV